MLYNYKTFSMLNEGREDKLEKQREKIHKFLKFDPIINYVFDNVVDKDSTKGLKYTTWFCDKIKNFFIKTLVENYPDWGFSDLNKKFGVPKTYINKNPWAKNHNYSDVNEKLASQFFKHYLETGKIEDFQDEKLKEEIKKRISNSFTWMSFDYKVSTIVDWLKSPIREEEINLSDYESLSKAYNKANNWHLELKASGYIQNETGTILMTFEDGYYWIDLETDSSRDEADAMGHCGTTSYGKTLYSLRKKQSPHVTSAVGCEYTGGYRSTEGLPLDTIFQMKGRNNQRPIDKYHPYIVELLSYPNVSDNVTIVNKFDKINNFSTIEYQSNEDFHISDLTAEQIIKLKEKNPELIGNMGLQIKYKLYKGGYLSKEELIKGYEDLKIIDDKIHFVFKEWTDFEKGIFKQNNNYRRCWQMDVLEGLSVDLFYNDLKFDYTYVYDKIKPYVFQEIMELIDKRGNYEVDYTIDDESGSLILSSENMSLNEKENDILISTPYGVIEFKKLMNPKTTLWNNRQQKQKIDVECERLDDLKHVFDRSYSMAQSLADESEAWETVTNAILNKIGPIIEKEKDKKWWDDGIHIDLNFDYIVDILNTQDTNYKSIIDILNNIPSDPDDNLIDVDIPYYGWSGTVDGSTLSEEISNILDEA